jgi:AraC family transcriptional regulator
MQVMTPGRFFGKTLEELRGGGVLLTLSRYAGSQIQPLHTHERATLFLLLDGRNRERTPSLSHEQRPFTFAYHPTHVPHSDEVGPAGMVGLNLELEPEFLERNGIRERALGGYGVLGNVEARKLAVRMVALGHQERCLAEAELESRVVELLEPASEQRSAPIDRASAPWLKRAEEFLRAHFADPIGLRHVASTVGMHPVYVARVFRRRHGCSVSERIRALRLLEAARLVLQERVSIAEAAQRSGFSDHAHLTRRFGREFGFPPRTLKSARRRFSS